MGFVEKRSGGYRDPLGRLTSKTFDRKADADRFLREMEVDVSRGAWIDPRAATVPLAEWADEFLLLARRLSPGTQQTYRRDITKYIVPKFGAVRLGRLQADQIEHWLNDELAAGLAPSTVHRHYRTLRRMLKVAIDKQRLQKNPCDNVDPPKVPHREMVFLNWAQAMDLAEAINPRYRALIYLAVDSGMRWGELIGLRRARVELGQRKVRVTEQLIRLDDGTWVRKQPKTGAGVRSLTISSFTAAELADHLDRYAAVGLEALVFPNQAGNPPDQLQLPPPLLRPGVAGGRSALPLPRSPPPSG